MGDIATAVKTKVLMRDNYVCWLCGKQIYDRPTVDHVIPLSRGGGNRQSNLRAAHKHCNHRRGNADIVFDRAYRASEIMPHIKTYPSKWVRGRLREAMLALDEMQSHFEALGHDCALRESCGCESVPKENYDGRRNIFSAPHPDNPVDKPEH